MAITEAKVVSAQADKDYFIIDADQHFFEPATMWKENLPEKFRDMAPYHVVDSMGLRREIIAGVTLPRLPKVPVPRRSTILQAHADSANHYGLDEKRVKAGSDPRARLEFMDADGVSAVVIFPTTALHFGIVQEVPALIALCRTYNDWASEYQKFAPDRFIVPAVIPQWDVYESVREARRAITELGMAGVVMRPSPIGRSLEDPAWEPLWATLNELKVPLAFHYTSGGTPENGPQPFGNDRTDNLIFQHMMGHPFEHMTAMLTMIGGGILDRHPDLKVAFIEAGCGWVPYWLERMEHHFEEPYENMVLSMTPTELFQRQCFVSADAEEKNVVAAFVDSLGAENIGWTTDFPHPDHEWTGMVSLFRGRTDLTEDAKKKIFGESAAKFWGYSR